MLEGNNISSMLNVYDSWVLNSRDTQYELLNENPRKEKFITLGKGVGTKRLVYSKQCTNVGWIHEGDVLWPKL